MTVETVDTLIIGAGLSGIYAAWLLAETSDHFGGYLEGALASSERAVKGIL